MHTDSRDCADRRAGLLGYSIYLAIWLIPGTALCVSEVPDEMKAATVSRPYLLVVSPPSLRFREALMPQPDLSTRPPGGAPPNPTASGPSPATKADQRPADAPAIAAAAPSSPAGPKQASPQDGPPAPAAIIPDETRPKVRPEDFLPYFEFPGTRPNPEDVSSVPTPPEPGRQPASTATYRQQ